MKDAIEGSRWSVKLLFMEERRRIEEDITLVSFKCHACK